MTCCDVHRLFTPPSRFCRLDGMRWTLVAEFASDPRRP